MNQLLSSDGLVSEISDIVAEASTQLPPLQHSYDVDFLKHQGNKAVSIFLHNLEAGETSEARTAFNDAQNSNDPIRAGVLLHESLSKDGSEQRARTAMNATRAEIQKTVVEDYQTFVRSIASRN